MQVTYTENPLETLVELDKRDRQILRLKLTIEELQETLGSSLVELENKDADLSGIRNSLEWSNWCGTKFEADITERLESLMNVLRSSHVGDCTCVPCSCSKCQAENHLGINTIQGLGKHQASYIYAAFDTEPTPSAREVIAKLESYQPKRSGGWENSSQQDFDKHVPRWTDLSHQAAHWLRAYTDKHFPLVPNV